MDDLSSSLEAHISRARASPVNLMIEESLTSAVQNKANSLVSTNPFEVDTNPFFEGDQDSDDDDYDKSLNPFAS